MSTQTHLNRPHEILQKHLNSHDDQYLTFILANEEYGVDILSVVEIRGLEKTTSIPSAPAFIKGVINLRGTIIPVMDLRERFGMPSTPYTPSTVLVVLQLSANDQKKEIGVIVDAVSDVYKINPEDIKPKPEFCNTVEQEYIRGLATITQENKSDKLIILLETNKILTINELHQFSSSDK